MVALPMQVTVDSLQMQESLPVQVDVVKTDLTNSHGSIATHIRAAQVTSYKTACAKKFLKFSKIFNLLISKYANLRPEEVK